jgi:hypothetical protein
MIQIAVPIPEAETKRVGKIKRILPNVAIDVNTRVLAKRIPG